MKVSAVITAKKLKLTERTGQSNGEIIAFLSIAAGLVFGCIIYCFDIDGFSETLRDYFINFATDFSNKNKPEILSGLIISDIPYLIFMIILGSSAVGAIPVLIISFFKSAGIGIIVTYLYSTYSLKGLEYCILIFFPAKVLMLFAMLLLTQSCYITGINIYRTLKNEKGMTMELSKYFLRSLLIYAVFIISEIVEFISIISFSSLFSFS